MANVGGKLSSVNAQQGNDDDGNEEGSKSSFKFDSDSDDSDEDDNVGNDEDAAGGEEDVEEEGSGEGGEEEGGGGGEEEQGEGGEGDDNAGNANNSGEERRASSDVPMHSGGNRPSEKFLQGKAAKGLRRKRSSVGKLSSKAARFAKAKANWCVPPVAHQTTTKENQITAVNKWAFVPGYDKRTRKYDDSKGYFVGETARDATIGKEKVRKPKRIYVPRDRFNDESMNQLVNDAMNEWRVFKDATMKKKLVKTCLLNLHWLGKFLNPEPMWTTRGTGMMIYRLFSRSPSLEAPISAPTLQ